MEQLMNKEVLQVMNEVYRRKPQFFIDNFSFFRDTLENREDSGFKRGEDSGFKRGEDSGFKRGEDSGFKRGEDSGFKRGALHTLQQMLIRQLHRNFKEVPASVVQRVEKTNDKTQLESWLDEVFTANSLAEMGLLSAEASHNGNGAHRDTND